jgi:hypothetical protein
MNIYGNDRFAGILPSPATLIGRECTPSQSGVLQGGLSSCPDNLFKSRVLEQYGLIQAQLDKLTIGQEEVRLAVKEICMSNISNAPRKSRISQRKSCANGSGAAAPKATKVEVALDAVLDDQLAESGGLKVKTDKVAEDTLGAIATKSKSTFGGVARTMLDDKNDMLSLFNLAQMEGERREAQRLVKQRGKVHFYVEAFRHAHKHEIEMLLETVISAIIVLNAIFLGVAVDVSDEYKTIVTVVDIVFGAIFIF